MTTDGTAVNWTFNITPVKKAWNGTNSTNYVVTSYDTSVAADASKTTGNIQGGDYLDATTFNITGIFDNYVVVAGFNGTNVIFSNTLDISPFKTTTTTTTTTAAPNIINLTQVTAAGPMFYTNNFTVKFNTATTETCYVINDSSLTATGKTFIGTLNGVTGLTSFSIDEPDLIEGALLYVLDKGTVTTQSAPLILFMRRFFESTSTDSQTISVPITFNAAYRLVSAGGDGGEVELGGSGGDLNGCGGGAAEIINGDSNPVSGDDFVFSITDGVTTLDYGTTSISSTKGGNAVGSLAGTPDFDNGSSRASDGTTADYGSGGSTGIVNGTGGYGASTGGAAAQLGFPGYWSLTLTVA